MNVVDIIVAEYIKTISHLSARIAEATVEKSADQAKIAALEKKLKALEAQAEGYEAGVGNSGLNGAQI